MRFFVFFICMMKPKHITLHHHKGKPMASRAEKERLTITEQALKAHRFT